MIFGQQPLKHKIVVGELRLAREVRRTGGNDANAAQINILRVDRRWLEILEIDFRSSFDLFLTRCEA